MAISDTPFDIRRPGMTLEDHLALARAPRLPPEKQWWNLPAKWAKAHQIADEERRRSIKLAHASGFPDAHNNAFDARRHAEGSRRMSTEIDPITSFIAGAGHEVVNFFEGQPHSEALMDKRNNAEGRRAAAEHRAVDPSRLQIQPDRPSPTNDAYRQARPKGGRTAWR